MDRYYGNGKLLLTGEYVVLDGAKALAVPTRFGQDLIVNPIQEQSIVWESFDAENQSWFDAEFRMSDLRIVTETFDSVDEDSKETIAVTLQKILLEAKRMNPTFLSGNSGFRVSTNLTFPRDWGLGTSSTLISNIAKWAEVDAYELLQNSFGGSGYDIACAKNDTPIQYQIIDKKPIVTHVGFSPQFKDALYFVYLNTKQNSRSGIKRYREVKGQIADKINEISKLTELMTMTDSIKDFEKMIENHEQIISSIIQNKPIKEIVFQDYFGAVKSLGAWGGDFVLATGNEESPEYFKRKGFDVVIPYKEMIL